MEIIQCPECHERYPDLLAIVEAGGEIRAVGMMLEAVCHCGHAFSVNKFWAKQREIEAVYV